MKSNYEMIFAIVNIGFTDDVMNAAREAGALGGTIINGRGTANVDAEQFFGISISSEKEIVMIIVPKKIKDDVLHSIYKKAGLGTNGQGIAFSVPVSDVVGISKDIPKINKG